jgi:hypothetical protein
VTVRPTAATSRHTSATTSATTTRDNWAL